MVAIPDVMKLAKERNRERERKRYNINRNLYRR